MPTQHGDLSYAVVVMNDGDNVGTALRDLLSGETVQFMPQSKKSVLVLDNIPFGHKIAIRDMSSGDPIVKYGEVIGRATVAIPSGNHVHVHNVEGIRGRGDVQQGGSSP